MCKRDISVKRVLSLLDVGVPFCVGSLLCVDALLSVDTSRLAGTR